MIYPTDGTVLIIAPSGIMKGVKHPNAARLFMEYLLSADASQIWVEHFNESMRPEVNAAGGAEIGQGREDDPADRRTRSPRAFRRSSSSGATRSACRP